MKSFKLFCKKWPITPIDYFLWIDYFIQCGFFERKKRKELNAFKRKTQMSIRSARSGGAGSVKSRRSNTAGSFRVKKMGDDHVKLHDKKAEDNTDNSTMESATENK